MSDDELAWETRSSTVAYTCPGFDVVHDEVRLHDGAETDFDYLSEPPAVVILPLVAPEAHSGATDAGDESGAGDGQREVVLIEEWRQAVDRINRGLPVGSVEPEDDDLEAAARRELREETGYEAEGMAHMLSAEPVNGIADSLLHFFLAEDCAPTAEQDLDPAEAIRTDTALLTELREQALAGELRDGRAVTAICYHALQEQGLDGD